MARCHNERPKMHKTMMRAGPRIWIACVAAGCLATIISGCGQNGPERVVVSGKVTFQGEPLKSGEIRFMPTNGADGSAEGALVTDGQYVANGRGGLPVGTYAVSIVTRDGRVPIRDLTPASVPAGQSNGDSPRRQLLPAKYNTRSQLEITVASGNRNIVQDFALTD